MLRQPESRYEYLGIGAIPKIWKTFQVCISLEILILISLSQWWWIYMHVLHQCYSGNHEELLLEAVFLNNVRCDLKNSQQAAQTFGWSDDFIILHKATQSNTHSYSHEHQTVGKSYVSLWHTPDNCHKTSVFWLCVPQREGKRVREKTERGERRQSNGEAGNDLPKREDGGGGSQGLYLRPRRSLIHSCDIILQICMRGPFKIKVIIITQKVIGQTFYHI